MGNISTINFETIVTRKNFWIAISLVVIIVLFYFYNPCNYGLFLKCPFLLLTGLQCPGCGSQRAIHNLLHLDILKAFYYNALLVFTLPVIVILLLAEYYRCNKPLFYFKVHNKKYIWWYLTIVILWWILRNVFNV